MTATRTVKVVGLTFIDGYPDNLHAIADMVLEAQKQTLLRWADDGTGDVTVPVILIRNPDNEYDPSAIEVHVPTLGRRASMIGHVPRDLAARLAPSLDRGDAWHVTVAVVLVDPEHPDRPGIEIRLAKLAETAA